MPKIGVCGDDCNYCPRYIATRSNEKSKLMAVAELWMRAGFRDRIVEPEELKCVGCSPKNNCAYREQLSCALEKKLSNCGECLDYPCGLAKKSFDKTKGHEESCRNNCSPNEYGLLRKAFFAKKENLDKINQKMRKAKK